MAKAAAIMNGRDYVTVEDVQEVFCDVCTHRVLLTQKARASHADPAEVLDQLLKSVKVPYAV
jgi:MoxR-like ATPase